MTLERLFLSVDFAIVPDERMLYYVKTYEILLLCGTVLFTDRTTVAGPQMGSTRATMRQWSV